MSTAAVVIAEQGRSLAQARRSGLTVLAIRVAGAALAYGTQVLLARVMGQAGYGVFAIVWVWISILGHASLFGVGQSICRFLPSYRVAGEFDLARGFLTAGAILVLTSACLIAAIGGLALWFGRELLPDLYVAPFAVALLVLPVFALQDYVEGVARSFNWTALAIAPPFILRQGLIGLSMALAVASGAPTDPWVAVAATLLATTAALILQSGLLVRRLRRALPAGARAYRFRNWASVSLPIAFVDLTMSGFNYVDVLILGIFMPPQAVGIYFAATRIQAIVVFAQYAATAATAARFAEASARGDRAALQSLIQGTVRLTTLATASLGVAIVVAAPVLLALFGPGFEASFPVLVVLIGGAVVQSAFGPAEDLLNMLGAERVCAVASLGALAIAVALNFLLIPLYGVMGAASAMAIAAVARGMALAIAARLRLGLATHVLARAG